MAWYKNLQQFKEENGYEIDGIWYPRVTAIVSIKSKPALYQYYANMPNFKTAEAVKEKSAVEGTSIHDTVEAILKGQPPAIPENIKPAISAFMDFYNRNNIVAHKVEERIISKKHKYSGTLDVLADINGHLGVLDIKTSKAIYRDYNIQTSAYVEALKESPNMPALTRWILRIDQNQKCIRCGASLRSKGGNPKVSLAKFSYGASPACQNHKWSEMQGECEFKELKAFNADIKAFLACKSLWEWENEWWIKQIY